jgi:short-subunit dehydrogenase
MKIAITGHTSGIGLSLYTKFKTQGHTVIGFSRATGYDIGSEDICSKLLNEITDCDVLVNNAYHSIGQNRILARILNNWNGTEKSVINISSNIVSVPYAHFDQYPSVQEYRTSKVVNNDIVNNYTGTVKILNILPEAVKTNFFLGKFNREFLEKGMSPDYVAELIINTFNVNKSGTLVIKNLGNV